MRFTFLLSALLLLSVNTYGRDQGYALECKSLTDNQIKLVSFLEIDINKSVNQVDNGASSFWDTHEWFTDVIAVRSFMQSEAVARPNVTSSVLIQRESLEAVLVGMGNPLAITKMQCVIWSPETRNK